MATLIQRLRNEQAAIVGWETKAAWFDDGEIDKEATDAVVALVEAAQLVVDSSWFKIRSEGPAHALQMALAAFTEDKP